MLYTEEELKWIENEWSRNLYGRTVFISREDYQQLLIWSDAGVPADVVVNAIHSYFQRHTKNRKGRSFVAMSYLTNDVARLLKSSLAINLNEALTDNELWINVKEPIRSDSRCHLLFKTWKHIKLEAPHNDSPAFLTYLDAEHKALKELVTHAESQLGDKIEPLRSDLMTKLLELKFVEGTLGWRRAWEHNWMRIVCDFWGIPWQL